MLRRFVNSLPLHLINVGQGGYDRGLARCLLETVHHLLLFSIASRQYLNLLHWLPILIALQQVALGYGGSRDQDETVLNGGRDVQDERGDPEAATGMCRYFIDLRTAL